MPRLPQGLRDWEKGRSDDRNARKFVDEPRRTAGERIQRGFAGGEGRREMSTENCPKCGAAMIWRDEFGMCDKCDYCTPELEQKQANDGEMLQVALHRVRELEQQSRNAAELRTLQREYDKRTNPELEVPDMRDLGQDVAFVCLMFHKQRKQIAELDNLRDKLSLKDSEIMQLHDLAKGWEMKCDEMRDLLRWRKCGDGYPPMSEKVLCFFPGYLPYLGHYTGIGNMWVDEDGVQTMPTHWRPIGPLPGEGGEG
jgi:hypothetical protein